jgi:hypothetical protein
MSRHDIAQAQYHGYVWNSPLAPELVYSTAGWAG